MTGTDIIRLRPFLPRKHFAPPPIPNGFRSRSKKACSPGRPKKLYIGNVCGFGATSCPAENYTVKLNTGQVNPQLQMSYIQFAMEGLRHQLSQGAGGWSVEPGDRFTYYKLLDSVVPPATDKDGHEKNFFDGIDTSLQGLEFRIRRERERKSWPRSQNACSGSKSMQKKIQAARLHHCCR